MLADFIKCYLFINIGVSVLDARNAVPYNAREKMTPRIVNGDLARPWEFPWVMGVLKNGKLICTFSLITDQLALGPAHCVFKSDIKDLYGVVGSNSFVEAIGVPFLQVTIHNKFDEKNEDHDIAIIELEYALELSHYIKPIRLPAKNRKFLGTAVIAGWGALSNESSEMLRKQELDIFEGIENCKRIYRNLFPIRDDCICAGSEGAGMGWGDCGTPLVYYDGDKAINIGIAIRLGKTCSQVGYSAVFLSTSYYADWIRDNTLGKVTFV